MSSPASNLVWLDLEMTGLNPDIDKILEIATIVTDSNLHIIAEGPVFAIHQSEAVLSQMDEWCTTQHGRSGLSKRVLESCISESQAENAMLEFLKQHVKDGASPLCGNSIWQDRRFLARHMPLLERFFHYRLIDVSTLKELAIRWAPRIYGGFHKESTHLALNDVHDSIAELRYYREHFLVRTAHITL